MPRQARKKSESGIYHVMLRGINRQRIFETAEDYEKFLQILREYKATGAYELYAYCLMGNHVHLLIKPKAETLEQIFKRIGGRYVYWFNVKYQRAGHLFQDRFKSEPVDTDGYFLTVLRYIHQNPVKASLCDAPEDYRYSSYGEYLDRPVLTDTAFALQMLPREDFESFHRQITGDICLDAEDTVRRRVTDEQGLLLLQKIAGSDPAQFQELPQGSQRQYIRRLQEEGLSIRQISRLTGVPKGAVERWGKEK